MTFLKTLKKSNEKITLVKLSKQMLEKQIQASTLFTDGMNICFLDLETTGLDKNNNKIIEIALKGVKIDQSNGSILSFYDEYQSFQDPSESISEEITRFTGITNDMVKGHEIDWEYVNAIIENSDLLIAHNARFDRGFLDKYLPLSKEKIWACSIEDITWLERGFVKQNLELLSVWHGFYFDSHRAMNDVDALIYLLTHPSYKNDKPISELINNSKIPYYIVSAKNSPFEKKDILRENAYRWNGEKKYWWKKIIHAHIEEEREWLTENVYNGYFAGIIEEILLTDKYKE